VEHADILDNVLARISSATTAQTVPAIYGLRGVALGRIRLQGNRLFSVGPPLARQITAIRLSPPFVEASISDNRIDRVAAPEQAADPTRWMAIDLTPEPLASVGSATDFVAPVRFLVSDSPPAYLLSATRLAALRLSRQQPARAAIQNNQVSARATLAPLCLAAQLDHCLFSENLFLMEAVEEGGSREPLLGLLQGRTLNASNNRLIGIGDLQTLWLRPGVERAVVIGNISTGPIVVQGGVPVPAEIQLTNIIGT
jgi:hypothetical protein